MSNSGNSEISDVVEMVDNKQTNHYVALQVSFPEDNLRLMIFSFANRFPCVI